MSKIFNDPSSKDEMLKLHLVYNFCKTTIVGNIDKYDDNISNKLNDLKVFTSLCENYMRGANKLLLFVEDVDKEEFSDVKKADLITTLSSLIMNTDIDLNNLSLGNLLLLIDYLTSSNCKKYQKQINVMGNDKFLGTINNKTINSTERQEILTYCNDLIDDEEVNSLNKIEAKELTIHLIDVVSNCSLADLVLEMQMYYCYKHPKEILKKII